MPFTSIANFKSSGDPTKAELALIAACQNGDVPTLPLGTTIAALPPEGQPTPDRAIRAALLRLLITGGTKDCGLHTSGVWLKGAYIIGELDLRFARAIGRCALDTCRFDEEPRLDQAHFAELSLQNSHLPGLFAQRITVTGSVFLRGLTATGTVVVNGAKITGQLACDGATLDGGKDAVGNQQKALNAQGAQVGADLFLNRLTVTGMVDVGGAKITGQLDCERATLDGGKDAKGNQQMALNGQRLHVEQGFFFRDVKSVTGQVYLDAAHVGDLADDAASWPMGTDQLYLNGFTYDRIADGPQTLAGRKDWLARGSRFKGTFHPQPYTHFARVLRDMGHASEARKVLMERQKNLAIFARANRRIVPNGDVSVAFRSLWADIIYGPTWFWDKLVNSSIGYGYQPWKAAILLIVLWLVAFGVAQKTWNEGSFAPNSAVILVSPGWAEATSNDCRPINQAQRNCDPNPAETWSDDAACGLDWDSFNAAGYAADLVIPVLDLGQTSAWSPSKDRGPWGRGLWWGRWAFEMLGWAITALGIASITGLVQKNQPD